MTRVKDVRELDEQLSELVDWERFAVHLGMSMSDINMIDTDKSGTANKKLAVYDKCLKAQDFLAWDTVVQALDLIGENTLAKKVKLAKSSCTNKSSCARTNSSVKEKSSRIRVCVSIASKLDVLNKNFVGITENLKRIIEKSLKSGSMTMEQIVSRTTEERAFIFPDELWQVTDTYSYFRVIQPFYSFLDCYLIVCLASLFVSSTVAVEAVKYEKKVGIFKRSTNVMDLHGELEVYFPQSLDEGMSVRLTVVVQQSWGRQKLWLVEELIKVLFGLEKKECHLWFRVRPGSVVIDLLLPQRLIMFAIVQCVDNLEFLQLMGVIAIRVGTILVMRKTENAKFSFQNSFIEACKLGKIEFVELLLRFSQVNVNKPSENMFLPQKDTELSFIPLLFELQAQFESVASAFMTTIIESEMIELSSLISCVNEQRPSLVSFFSSVMNKSDFFSVAQCFVNFLNVSFLVAIEKESIQFCSDQTVDFKNFAERVESIKKAASISCLVHSVQSKLQSGPPPLGTILACIVLSNEWQACSISIIEKLVLSIFSILKSRDELQLLEISSESNKIVAIFYFPKSFQKQLVKSSKEKLGFMKSLGIKALKISDEVVLQSSCDIFSFENAFFEAKKNNDVDVLKFLSEIQQDLLPMRSQGYFDENNNMTFECDPDSTALMISSAQRNLKLMKFLLDNEADPSIQTKTGATALRYAVYRGDYRIVQLLIKHNPHLVNISDPNKFSSLHIVCAIGNAKILELLMTQKLHLNAKSSDGITPLYIACNGLDVSLVSLLLKANADPNIPDNNGTTPLSIATEANCLPIVQCLLKAHANPNIKDKFETTALLFAVRNNNFKIFKCLMDANADPRIETSFNVSAFHLACHAGFVKMLKHILKHTNEPDFKLKNGLTPLYSACSAGQMEVVKLLIEANADVNIPFCDDEDKIMRTPLMIACSNNNLKMVKLLLKAKADSNFYDKLTKTFPILGCAILSGSPAIVISLLKAGADPDARSTDLNTPLHFACFIGNLEIINHLLKAKANPNVQNKTGITPLLQVILLPSNEAEAVSMFMATFGNHTAIVPIDLYQYEIVDALLIAGADPNIPDRNNSTPLYMAASEKVANIVIRLLEGKADPNIQAIDGKTPLHQATTNKDPNIIKILLKEKADPNIVESTGNEMAPLHIACGPDGSLETAQAILSSSSTNPNILDAKKNTPLHYAAFIANPKILQSLIASNANPNIKNQDGATPLSVLCGSHDTSSEVRVLKSLVEMVNMILGANADPNVQMPKDKLLAPLHLACCKGWLEIVNSLLKAKANPNIKAENGITPLLLMIQVGIPDTMGHTGYAVPTEYEIVDALLNAGADPNIVGIDNYTPIYVAAGRGEADIVVRLLEGKADPNVQCSHELITPLHLVCMSGCLGIVKILVKAKADPNIQDVHGSTPLVLMLSDNKEGSEDPPNQYEIVDALLQAQADPNIADKIKNITPLFLAASKGKTDIVTRLLREKANINIQTKEGATPLQVATFGGHVEVMKILLKKKADPNILDRINGIAPLHIACNRYKGSLEKAQIILSCPNTNPNILDGKHQAPIHYAVSNAQPKILHCLIASNANPNIRNHLGLTPLHIACNQAGILPKTEGNADATALEMAGILLKAKADPHMDSILGTAFEIAISKQNAQLLLILFLHRNN